MAEWGYGTVAGKRMRQAIAEEKATFRPDLRVAPVVVLSNNDGCVIAQSREAKVLSIRMAGPWFEVEERAREIGVVEFSSNYELYANMSHRFMATLKQFSPRQEVYSIDECFLDFTGMKRDLVAYGHTIRETVMCWTGDCPSV